MKKIIFFLASITIMCNSSFAYDHFIQQTAQDGQQPNKLSYSVTQGLQNVRAYLQVDCGDDSGEWASSYVGIREGWAYTTDYEVQVVNYDEDPYSGTTYLYPENELAVIYVDIEVISNKFTGSTGSYAHASAMWNDEI